MNIGILTFHRSINYGAVTQCYALQRQIKSDFPEDNVEVIDYIPKGRWKFYQPSMRNYFFASWRYIDNPVIKIKSLCGKLLQIKNFFKVRRRFDAFQKSLSCLNLSEDFICTDDCESFRRRIQGKYDIIVVGSDCVWEWTILGIPSPYYLLGDFHAIKLSYAACSAVNDYRTLDEKDKNYLRQSFESYEYLGVRDSATAFNVRELCPHKNVHLNCDPTALLNPEDLEYHRQRVKSILTSKGIDWTKPIVGLMSNEIIGKLAYDIFGDSVQYVGIYAPNKYATIFIEDLLVLEWASIFGLFSITFTTFFHGTMLSLVNKTPVMSFDYYEGDEGHLSKIEELYRRLDLTGYYHKGKQTYDKYDVEFLGQTARYMLNNSQSDIIARKMKKESESYSSFHEALKKLHHQYK